MCCFPKYIYIYTHTYAVTRTRSHTCLWSQVHDSQTHMHNVIGAWLLTFVVLDWCTVLRKIKSQWITKVRKLLLPFKHLHFWPHISLQCHGRCFSYSSLCNAPCCSDVPHSRDLYPMSLTVMSWLPDWLASHALMIYIDSHFPVQAMALFIWTSRRKKICYCCRVSSTSII